MGPRLRRRWDHAQTPYERVAATAALPATQRAGLDALYQTTNPRALRRAICDGIEAILLLQATATTEPAA